jgi:hypothetical protein
MQSSVALDKYYKINTITKNILRTDIKTNYRKQTTQNNESSTISRRIWVSNNP